MITLNKTIHDPIRFQIIMMLSNTPNLDFYTLRNITGTTDGNLATHIRTLEQVGFIMVNKVYADRRVRTLYCITPQGSQALSAHLNQLETLVDQGKNALLKRYAVSF